MKKSDRLKVIVDLNSESEKKVLKELGSIQRKKNELLTQLDNLQNYQQDYIEKYQSISQSGVNIAQLLEFRAFISKLDKAIDEQRQAIDKINEEVSFARKNWEIQHQKTKGLKKVCNSALAEELKVEDKREQNELDDRASRKHQNSGIRNA
jgi:flagellar FliJ protein